MGFESKIEWTTHTFNPWWGYTKVSDGCKFCYAESIAKRYGQNVWGPNVPRRTMSDAYWQQPAKWNRDARSARVRAQVFCASMADVFEPDAPEDQRERLWQVIRETPELDWQLLTKRPQHIAEFLPEDWGVGWHNVWLGTSIEDQRVAVRSQQLNAVPAQVRFLSVEPLIGAVDELPLNGISWVIIGGESGPGARPMRVEWAQSVIEQCLKNNVACFFKQAGSVLARQWGAKGKGNDWEQFPTNFQRREMPAAVKNPQLVLA